MATKGQNTEWESWRDEDLCRYLRSWASYDADLSQTKQAALREAARRLRQSDPGGREWWNCPTCEREGDGSVISPPDALHCPMCGTRNPAAPTDEAPETCPHGKRFPVEGCPDCYDQAVSPPVEEGERGEVEDGPLNMDRIIDLARYNALHDVGIGPENLRHLLAYLDDLEAGTQPVRAPDARQGEGDTDEVALRKMFHRAWREYHDMYGHDADEAMDAFCDWVREVLSEHLATLSEQL